MASSVFCQSHLASFCKNISNNISKVLNHLNKGLDKENQRQKKDLVDNVHRHWQEQGANIQNTITENLDKKLCPHGDSCSFQNEYFSSRRKSDFEVSESDLNIHTLQWTSFTNEVFNEKWSMICDVFMGYKHDLADSGLTDFVNDWFVYSEYIDAFWKYINDCATLESGECAFKSAMERHSGQLKMGAKKPQLPMKSQTSRRCENKPNKMPSQTTEPSVGQASSTPEIKRDEDDGNTDIASTRIVRQEQFEPTTKRQLSEEKLVKVEILKHELNVVKENKMLEGQVQHLVMQNEILKKEKTALLDETSRSMNRQMSRNESNLENINIKVRPMTILEEFSNFCSQEWLDAKTAMDEQVGDWMDNQTECELLGKLIEECYQEASTKYMIAKQRLVQLFKEPFNPPKPEEIRRSMIVELDLDLELAVSKELRITSDSANMAEDTKVVLEKVLSENSKTSPLKSVQEVVSFTEAALRLSWKMILQQPPMAFDRKSLLQKSFNDQQSELFYGSCDPKTPGALVQFYVHPALYHGEKLMKKAVVILRASKKPKPLVRQQAV